jgi:hypothetical protein
MISLSWATCPFWRKLVSFHGRHAHTHSLVYFHGWPTHKCSSWSIFRGDWLTHSHGLFSWATYLTLTLVYFHGLPVHTCSSWSIFRGDRPSHSHGLFSWATCPHIHIGLFSQTTCPHMFILVYFQGRPAHTYSSWSIFRGNRPSHSHDLFSWATCPHTPCPHMFILVYF